MIARASVAVLPLALAFLFAGTAGAATVADDPPAVDQYVEQVPTGDGKTSVKKKKTPLSSASARALASADRSLAAALEEVATSSAYGAPDKKLSPTGRNDQTNATLEVPDASFVGSIKAVGSALAGGGGRPLILLVVMVAITIAAAIIGRRNNRSAP